MKYIQRKQVAAIPVVGAVTDTWNVTDKTANAPSLRLMEPLIIPEGVCSIDPNYATSSSITTAFGGANKIKEFCQNFFSKEKDIVIEKDGTLSIGRKKIISFSTYESGEYRIFSINFIHNDFFTILNFRQLLTNIEMNSFESCFYSAHTSLTRNIGTMIDCYSIFNLNNYSGKILTDLDYTKFDNILPGNYFYYQSEMWLPPDLFLILYVSERYSGTKTYRAFTIVSNDSGNTSLSKIEVYTDSNDTVENVYFSSNSSAEEALACFTADTPIAVLNGTKLISEIKLDDEVVSYNQETLTLENKKVAAIVCHKVNTIYKIQTENNIIKATGIHPMHTIENGKIFARDVKSGNHLLTKDGKLELVQSIEVISGEECVYDLGVEDNYTYFVGENPVLVYTEDSTKNFI